jgi:hypothetical protein
MKRVVQDELIYDRLMTLPVMMNACPVSPMDHNARWSSHRQQQATEKHSLEDVKRWMIE